MHDGYLFTLGVCGSASDSGPAPAMLDLMLAALPPVKRAAYLGEVLVSEGLPSLVDPLVGPLLAELADAEVLLIVTPLIGGALPGRVLALARAIERYPLPPARRFAALITVGAGADLGLLPLRRACQRAQIEVVGESWLEPDTNPTAVRARLAELARQLYSAARQTRPDALP